MKNLKRALSFALATVMVIGMMVVGAGAAFTDEAKIDNGEAADVMAALNVITGKPDGDGLKFDPDAILTRAEAAKIITYMLLGPTKAELLGATGAKFSDVPAGHWAETYIGYCANMGIISGYAGEFNPTGELTGLAFGKMLLVALGYDAAIEGYTGTNDWGINVAVDMVEAGIDLGDEVALDAALSRDNAAQMAFNTLTATLVKYATKGTSVTINGVDIVSGAATAEPQKWATTTGWNYTNGSTTVVAGDTIQFCEKFFNKLYQDATPVNGKDGYTWKLTNKVEAVSDFIVDETVIGTATNNTSLADLGVYSTTNTKYIADIDFANVEIYVNGDQVTATSAAANTYWYDQANKAVKYGTPGTDINGYGVKIELIDTNDNVKTAEKIYFTEYEVKVLNADVKTKVLSTDGKEYVFVDFTAGTDIGDSSYNTVLASKVTGYEGLKKNDIVIVVAMDNGTYTITKLNAVVGQASAVSGTTLTIGGTAIKAAAAADTTITSYAEGFNKDVKFYYDAYGYTVYAKAVAATSTDYLYVLENGSYTTTIGATGNISRVVFADGVKGQITVNQIGSTTWASGNLVAPTVGGIYAYTKNADGTYNLIEKTEVDSGATAGAITKGVSLATATNTTYNIKCDTTTVYVVYKSSTDTWTDYTGYTNVPSMTGVTYTAVKGTDTYADIVFVSEVTTTTAASSKDTIYLLGTTFTSVYKADGSAVDYYTLPALVNGVVTTVKTSTIDLTDATGLGNGADVAAKALYAVTYSDGKLGVNSMDAAAGDSGIISGATTLKVPANGVVEIGSTGYNYAENCVVYVINAAANAVEVTDINGYNADLTYTSITAVTEGFGVSGATAAQNATVTAIYLQK